MTPTVPPHSLDDFEPHERGRHLVGCPSCRALHRERARLREAERLALASTTPDDDALFARAEGAHSRSNVRRGVAGALALAAAAALLFARPWRDRASSDGRPAIVTTPSSARPHGARELPARSPADGALTRGGEPERETVRPLEGTLTLGDGSTLAAAPGTEAEVRTEREGVVRVVLARGEVSVVASRSAARRLGVEHEGWSAWVHGTRFTVTARPRGIEVLVREGDVLVRGPGAPEGVHALGGTRWRAVGREAPRALQGGRVVASRAPGEGAEALAERWVQEGVLALARGDAGTAQGWFERYLARWPRGALSEDALAGVMDARWQLRDREGASEAARRYLARFPRGVASARARERVSRSDASDR